jgi:hypothetical protein
MSASEPSKQQTLVFTGSNWEDLDRLIALAKFHFLIDDDFDDNEPRRCAHLSKSFGGPALDWSSSTYAAQPAIFEDFDGYILALKQAFGVEANGIQALRRNQLDALRWGVNVPVFFAEYDRLTFQLGITDHGTRIVMLNSKLPLALRTELARQALDFANYETMRERLITMWALNPHGAGPAQEGPQKVRRCGACGKKGHDAANCRRGTKN